jgi:hypothetical protein
MFRFISTSAIIFACLGAAGCGDNSTPTTPAEPPVQVTETFTGTLNVNGAAMHTFLTDKGPAQAQATINSLSPDSAASVSFILGTWNGNNCQVILVKDDATTGSSLVGTASAVGSFCVRIADIGRLTAPTDYSITVTHY